MRLTLPVAINRTTTNQTRRVANVAHRGASTEAAENTLSAVRRAIELVAVRIERDVQSCRDGALVRIHHTTLRPRRSMFSGAAMVRWS